MNRFYLDPLPSMTDYSRIRTALQGVHLSQCRLSNFLDEIELLGTQSTKLSKQRIIGLIAEFHREACCHIASWKQVQAVWHKPGRRPITHPDLEEMRKLKANAETLMRKARILFEKIYRGVSNGEKDKRKEN